MDKIEKYIKMCKKAIKIRKEWKPCFGDLAYELTTKSVVQISGHAVHAFKENPFRMADYIWLPRQDQLQEMISKESIYLIGRFHSWFYSYPHSGGSEKPLNATLEQLWLAFVMHEKYGKVWNEEKEGWA